MVLGCNHVPEHVGLELYNAHPLSKFPLKMHHHEQSVNAKLHEPRLGLATLALWRLHVALSGSSSNIRPGRRQCHAKRESMHLEPHPQFEASSISMHAADSTTCDMPPAIPAAIAYLEFHMTVYCYAMDSPAIETEN